MVRRRRETAPEEPGAPMAQPAEGAEPQIDVRMRGTADQVKKQLGVATEDKPEKKPEDNGHDDEKKKFVEALRNSKYIIRVKRLTPREFSGMKTNVEVWSAELPLSYQEIQEEITKACGGGKYRVAVVDPNSNTTISADTFEVDGDPIIPEMQMTQEEQDRIFMQGKPKSAADLTEEGLERRARLTAKQIEVEAYEEQLTEARKRREGGGKQPAQDNTRVDELERRLSEAKHQAELESRDRKHAEEMRELKSLISQNAKPQRPEGSSDIALVLQQMTKMQEASASQFRDLLKSMQDDKMNTMIRELQAIKNKPAAEGGGMIEMFKAFRTMAEMMGMDLPGGKSEDDEDDDDPDKPWYEKLADRYLPKLLDAFDEKVKKGEPVSREEFMRDLGAAAKQAEDEAVARAQQRITGQAPRAALPPPPATLPPPPPPGTTGPVNAMPPPPPVAASSAPENIPQAMTLAQEIVIRVGGVLEMLEREMELRPNEYLWNYEGAYNALPEAILEKVCAAPDPVAMIDAFAIEHISAEKLAELKAKIGGNPRILSWVKMGHDELKLWWAEKLKDPKYDPFAEEEEEG